MAKKKQASWKDQRHSLEQRKDAVAELTAQYGNEADEDLCRMLTELKTEKERLENELQLVSERLEAIGQLLADRWEQSFQTSVTIDDVTYSRQLRLYVSAADKERYHQWLKDNGMEVLIQPTVAPKTTEALVRERLEEGLPVDQEEMGLKVTYKNTVR
jgi:hypothetical protein